MLCFQLWSGMEDWILRTQGNRRGGQAGGGCGVGATRIIQGWIGAWRPRCMAAKPGSHIMDGKDLQTHLSRIRVVAHGILRSMSSMISSGKLLLLFLFFVNIFIVSIVFGEKILPPHFPPKWFKWVTTIEFDWRNLIAISLFYWLILMAMHI